MQRSVNSTVLCGLAALALTAGGAFADEGAGTSCPFTPTADVLILGSSVSGGLSSLEALRAIALGYTVDIVTDCEWSKLSVADFDSYRCIVIGDPTCGNVSAVVDANACTWGSVIDGNVVVISTDPVFHQAAGGGQLVDSAFAFAAAEAGKTGAYLCLSCEYSSAGAGSPVPELAGFCQPTCPTTCFTSTGALGCFNDVHIVATSPALTGLVDADLANWSCSVHGVFDTWPSTFIPLAIALDPAGPFTAGDGTVGYPYILASGDITPVGDCAVVTNDTIECDLDDPSKITWSFDLTNLSGVDASWVVFTPQTPDSSMISFMPNMQAVSILDGSTESLSVMIKGIGGLVDLTGVEICFTITMLDDTLEECCSLDICLTPDCDCLQMVEEVVECLPEDGKYLYTFDLQNLTGDVLEHLYFFPPAGVTILGDATNYVDLPTTAPGATTGPITVTICFDPDTEIPGKLLLDISVHDQFLEECCSRELSITLPRCTFTGACCVPGAGCVIADEHECEDLGGIFMGPDVPCEPGVCEDPRGACCLPGGACAEITAIECEASGGLYFGDAVPCDPDLCEMIVGGCCPPDGSPCVLVTFDECEAIGGTYLGDGSPCVDPCPASDCPGDCDFDGVIGFGDLLLVLSQWGPCAPPCWEDLNHDGVVDFGDVLILLGTWGPC